VRAFLPFLLLCSLAHAWPGHESNPIYNSGQNFEIEGESLPDWVNLARKFRAEIPQQGDAGTCASFSTVALMEAACKTVLHKEIDLSEAHVIASTISSNLMKFPVHPSDLGLSNRLISTHAESGNPFRILESMFHNGLRLEEEWKHDTEFIPAMEKMKTELLRESFGMKGTYAEVSRVLTDKLLARLAEHTAPRTATAKHTDAIECLEKLSLPQKIDDGSSLVAMSLLANGIPLSCVGGSGFPGHAYLIVGYRRNEKASGGREWLIRDSAKPGDPAKWEAMNENYGGGLCDQIAYVVPKVQAEKIHALVEAVEKKAKASYAKRHLSVPPFLSGTVPPSPPGTTPPSGVQLLGSADHGFRAEPAAIPPGASLPLVAPAQIPSLPK